MNSNGFFFIHPVRTHSSNKFFGTSFCGPAEAEEFEDEDNIEKMFDIENETNANCNKKDIEITNNLYNIQSNDNAICVDEYDIGF